MAPPGFNVPYRVLRRFGDCFGFLEVDAVPDKERVATWTNLEALLNLGFLEICKDAMIVSRAMRSGICPECDQGPFKRLDVHVRRHHRDTERRAA